MIECDLSGCHYVIAGGSGFLGVSLANYLLENNARVSVLSRSPSKAQGNWDWKQWDGRTLDDWWKVLDGADGVINLAGRTVDCIKTPETCDEIIRSRVESTRTLGQALKQCSQPPRVWVQMSTAHIYGDPPKTLCEEDSALGYGLAPEVGKAWEAALHESCLPTQRTVLLRTSFVIGKDRGAGGGALSKLKMLTRFGLGGTVGSGKQGMSWIHELDMNRIVLLALVDGSTSGVYIASSPHPLEQKEFMRLLRKCLRMPIGLPATELMVRFGAKFVLRTDPELALYGRYVAPRRLLDTGFDFKFPELDAALRDLLRKND